MRLPALLQQITFPWSLALVLVTLVVIISSLTPLKLVGSWEEVKAALEAGMTLSIQEPAHVTVAQRLIAFLPLGFLIYRRLVQLCWRHPGIAASILMALTTLTIELMQAVVSMRHPLLSDLIIGSAAGFIGILLSYIVIRGYRGYWLQYQGVYVMCFLLLGNIAMLGTIAIVHSGSSIAGWECSYPLVVGNELTQDRPWRGKIRSLAVYPRELTDTEIQRLARAPLKTLENVELRRAMGAVALYRFATIDGDRIPQLITGSAAVDLLVPKSSPKTWQLEDSALDIRGSILIRSTGPAHAICKAILASRAFTVETEIASSDLSQDGPARIITISSDSSQRNLTLGEQKGDLVLRVRTPVNGLNGGLVQLQSRHKALSGGWHHIAASYAQGEAKLFVDGTQTQPPFPYHSMLLFDGIRLIASMALLSMGTVAVVALGAQPLLMALFLGFCITALVPIIFYFTLTAMLGRDPDPIFIAITALTPIMGILSGWIVRSQKELLLGLCAAALIPLSLLFLVTVWLGKELDLPTRAAVLLWPIIGLIAGWILRLFSPSRDGEEYLSRELEN
jgi:hypothetical protein